MHKYTTKEIEYLRKISPGRSNKEITEKFNERFNLNINSKAIASTRKRYNIKSGLDGRFKKGSDPWNKGMKGLQIGGVETQFKKGQKPINYKPIGSERITKDGYVEIKIKDPNKWRTKHSIIWEKHNGKVPKGHVVIFGDGNPRNFDLDNLILVDRHQLLLLNQHKLIKDNTELTKTGVQIANVYKKIREVKRRV